MFKKTKLKRHPKTMKKQKSYLCDVGILRFLNRLKHFVWWIIFYLALDFDLKGSIEHEFLLGNESDMFMRAKIKVERLILLPCDDISKTYLPRRPPTR